MLGLGLSASERERGLFGGCRCSGSPRVSPLGGRLRHTRRHTQRTPSEVLASLSLCRNPKNAKRTGSSSVDELLTTAVPSSKFTSLPARNMSFFGN